MAKNVVIDTWRAEQRRPRLVTDEETIAAQPVEDRLYYTDFTVTETAQSLGIPPGTVKSRAYYAVRVLRTAFEEMGMTR